MNLHKNNQAIVKQAKYINVIASAAILISGILLLILTDMPTSVLQATVGSLFLISGGAKLLGYFSNDLYRLAFQFDLALGCFSVLLAAFIFFAPDSSLVLMPCIVGVYVTVGSLLKIQTAIDARRFGITKWWMILVTAAVSVTVGILSVIADAVALDKWVMHSLALTVLGGENIWITAYTVRVHTK